MKTLRFHRYGEPGDVLCLDDADLPEPKLGHVRVRVHACGLNPADWALCRGLFAGDLPRGIGLDVAGIVDAIGDGVTGVVIGDAVLGVPAYQEYSSAGAADHAVLSIWTPVPAGLDLLKAAALPMAIETPQRCLNILGVTGHHTLFVYGAGTMIGFAAVQMARLRGARVVAAAGETFATQLRATGAEVTPYGNGHGGAGARDHGWNARPDLRRRPDQRRFGDPGPGRRWRRASHRHGQQSRSCC